jgi:preprotein translocase subunit SecY
MNTNLQNTKSQSLRSRILLTMSLLTLVRLGTFIPVPYLDRDTFTSLLQNETSSSNAVAQVLNTFSGGGNNSFGLLSLGILPYINASIIIQLLTTALPSLSKMQKEEGEYGRRKITDYVRYLTLFWAIVESISVTYNLRGLIFDWSFWTGTQISLTLISGSMIVLWFSELITRNGLGNGSSLLICFNIISSLPDQIKFFIFSLKTQNNALTSSLFLIGIFLITTIGCIYINEAIIKIPLVSARQLLRKKTSKSKDFGNSILPLRVNQAGVMPLVFTSYAMVVLSFLVGLIKNQSAVSTFLNQLPFFNETLFYWVGKIIFWAIYASLIFFFTYFYSTIVLDPKDVEERFRKNSVVILGIRPGKATKSYLTKTLKRIASINAIFLISNIVGLQVLESILNLNVLSLRGLGFTSQLILVNVLIDTLKRIRSFLNENETTL